MHEDAHLEAAYEDAQLAGPNEYYNDADELSDECMLCNEPLGDDEEVGEFYDPKLGNEAKAIVAHADCGLSRGLAVA